MDRAGWATLDIIPSLKGLGATLDRETAGPMREAGAKGGQIFGDEAAAQATEGFSSKFKDWAKRGAAGLGLVVGGAVGLGIRESFDRDQVSDLFAAQLGLDPEKQRRMGRIAGTLYANAYGESFADVNAAVAATTTSIRGLSSNRDIKRATADALNFAQVFEVDVARGVQVAGTLINSKLAKDSDEAFDLLVRSAQKVPAALREDVLDAVEEYGQFFRTLGYDGPQAFDLLVAGSKQGMYGIDKAGDAIKEFTIRATDGSKASTDALKAIGLDSVKMADDLLAGGDVAQEATQKIIQGLLDIESPSLRAQTAIALFGTPLEDLNVRKIPGFLRALQGTSGELDGVKGAAERMGDTLADNVGTDVTMLKRKLENDLVKFLSSKGLPALESFSDWMTDDGIPALEDTAKFAGKAAGTVKDMVGWLNDLPDPAKYAGLATLVTGISAVKIRGGGGGLLGGAGKVLGVAKPVPVFVTNKGFGGPGDSLGGGGKSGLTKLALGSITSIAVAAAGTVGIEKVSEKLAPDTTRRGNWGTPNSSVALGSTNRDGGIIDMTGFLGADDTDGVKKAKKEVDDLRSKMGLFGRELDLVGAKKINPALTVKGLDKANEDFARFIGYQIDAGRPVTPYINTTSIERAIALARTLKDELPGQAIPERGVDNGATYQHGGTGVAGRVPGVTFERVEIVAHDYGDFMQQAQRRVQQAGLGGVAQLAEGGVNR